MKTITISNAIEAAQFAAELTRQGTAFKAEEFSGSYTFNLTGF